MKTKNNNKERYMRILLKKQTNKYSSSHWVEDGSEVNFECREASQEDTPEVQARDEPIPDQTGSKGDKEKLIDIEYITVVKLTGLADGLDVRGKEKDRE